MSGLPFKEEDLYSFGGLIFLVPVIVLGFSKLFGPFSMKLAHGLILGLTFLIGYAVKLTVAAAFPGFGKVGLAVGLLLATIAASQAYDTAANMLSQSNKTTPPSSGPPTDGPGPQQGG